ncbi:hypothetical protein BYT27DRAFT_7191290 [Phlegmacium glaucopus]|nr:hypothetical protein BYT27DRAFT_7191290 [Phlegmacium glaucopus]
MASSLASTFDVQLLMLFFGTVLYGMGLLQCWLYFHWYPRDCWRIKSTVLLVLIFETFQTISLLVSIYIQLRDYEPPKVTTGLSWLNVGQVTSMFISALIVQVYYAHTLYAFDRNNIYCSVSIVSLALIAFGFGAGQTIASQLISDYALLSHTRIIACTEKTITLLCDISITVALCSAFSLRRLGIRSTDYILHKLTMYAIGRGVLTAIAAAFNLILFLAFPDNPSFLLAFVFGSKLYMNSMLFSLNSRQHIRNQADRAINMMSINLSDLPVEEPPQDDGNSRLKISTPPGSSIPDTNDWEEIPHKARFRRLSQPTTSTNS